MVLEELEFVPVPPTETQTLSAGTNGMKCHNQHQLSSTRFSTFRALRRDFKLLEYILIVALMQHVAIKSRVAQCVLWMLD